MVNGNTERDISHAISHDLSETTGRESWEESPKATKNGYTSPVWSEEESPRDPARTKESTHRKSALATYDHRIRTDASDVDRESMPLA